jgi:putative transposase
LANNKFGKCSGPEVMAKREHFMSRRKEPVMANELLNQLLAGGDAGSAFGHGRLLDSLKKALTGRALNSELDHHLSGDGALGNSRNGYGKKTVLTDAGRQDTEVPRDRQASFDPQLIGTYQRWFPGEAFPRAGKAGPAG